MKKLLFLMLAIVWTFSFQSCSKDDNDNSEWRDANEAAFNTVASNAQYTATTTPGGPGTVYRKEITKGTGTEKPVYTSTVKIKYKAMLYDKTVFSQSPEGVSATIKVNGTAPGLTADGGGFAIALQNMVVGDKWEVWIPWELGGGSYNSTVIPSYSTLVYEVELGEIVQNW